MGEGRPGLPGAPVTYEQAYLAAILDELVKLNQILAPEPPPELLQEPEAPSKPKRRKSRTTKP